jgi:hypothetical protein
VEGPAVSLSGTSLAGDLSGQTKELLALPRCESRKHGAAVFDVRIAQPDGQPLSTGGEFDANDTAVVGCAAPLDQAELL